MHSKMIALVLAIGFLPACGKEPMYRFAELKECSHESPADLRSEDMEKIQVGRTGNGLRARVIAPLTCMFTITNPKVTYERDRVVLSVDNAPYPPDAPLIACICMRHLQFDLLRAVKSGTPIVFVAEDRQYASGYAP